MLDRRFVAQNPQAVEDMLRRRHASEQARASVQRFAELEQERKSLLRRRDEQNRLRNQRSRTIGQLMRQGKREEAELAKAQVRAAGDDLGQIKDRLAEVEAEVRSLLVALPNRLDARVPDGRVEEDAVEVERWGEPTSFEFDILPHDELGERLGILDLGRAARMSGARFAVLKGAGAALERGLINFFLHVHTTEHGYTEVMVPYLVWRKTMEGTGQLPKFEEDLFKLAEPLNGSDAFLVPTAEVPVTNLHREEILPAEQLPLKYCCFTPCFRAEAGSYGRDTKGLIRQHQFHKVELVQIGTEEMSDQNHHALTGHAEVCLRKLQLPYRRVRICAGDASAAAAYQYDLEVWIPSQNRYREVSSCSNFWDYQARRMQLRYRQPGIKGTKPCHTTNGSGLAVGRTLVAILENYQRADGSVLIPEALRPFMGGLDRIAPPE